MSRQAIEQLLDRWIHDDHFRAELRKDPESTIRKTGADLSSEEWSAVKQIDWSLPDEELKARANKAVPTL
ncbi:MAG: hypothetical protein HY921_04620 [Elusimicrobia bacterium]|nr:hypothetical protein [Elusimicrobiota bacterium]